MSQFCAEININIIIILRHLLSQTNCTVTERESGSALQCPRMINGVCSRKHKMSSIVLDCFLPLTSPCLNRLCEFGILGMNTPTILKMKLLTCDLSFMLLCFSSVPMDVFFVHEDVLSVHSHNSQWLICYWPIRHFPWGCTILQRNQVQHVRGLHALCATWPVIFAFRHCRSCITSMCRNIYICICHCSVLIFPSF